MVKRKYNINELLDYRKELEEQIKEVAQNISQEDLTYSKVTYTDTKRKAIKVDEDREKITLDKYSQKFEELSKTLASVKSAISKFNADELEDLIFQREKCRNMYVFLERIKSKLPKKRASTEVSRTDKDDIPVEYKEVEVTPMFDLDIVEKRMNEIASEERKLNTKIQKINLNAEIEL